MHKMPFRSNPEDSPLSGNPGAWGNTWFLAQVDGMPWQPGGLMHSWQWVPPWLGEHRWLLRTLILDGQWSWLGNRAQYPPFKRPAYCWVPSFHLAQDYASGLLPPLPPSWCVLRRVGCSCSFEDDTGTSTSLDTASLEAQDCISVLYSSHQNPFLKWFSWCSICQKRPVVASALRSLKFLSALPANHDWCFMRSPAPRYHQRHWAPQGTYQQHGCVSEAW